MRVEDEKRQRTMGNQIHQRRREFKSAPVFQPMNTNDQIKAVQPLIDQVADLIRHGQHPDASPRFQSAQAERMSGRPDAPGEQAARMAGGFNNPEATAQPKAKTALAEAAAYHLRQMEQCQHELGIASTPRMLLEHIKAHADWHQRMATAIMESEAMSD